MKALFTLMIVVGSFSFFAQAQGAAKQAEVLIKTEVFCNHCDHCESCKPRIETALFEITGVKQAKLNIETQTIKVVYNPKKTTENEIKEAVLKSGYSADGVQPTAEAYGKLDGCCKRK